MPSGLKAHSGDGASMTPQNELLRAVSRRTAEPCRPMQAVATRDPSGLKETASGNPSEPPASSADARPAVDVPDLGESGLDRPGDPRTAGIEVHRLESASAIVRTTSPAPVPDRHARSA